MNIAQIGEQSEIEVEFLIYSNVELLDVYFRENLWSTDYYTQKKAENFKTYTDGYACQMKIKTNSSSLETTGEGFGILLSQYGFQQSYDSESQ